MDRAFGELLGWFCIDRKKAPIDEFFGDLQNFLKDFDVSAARAKFCQLVSCIVMWQKLVPLCVWTWAVVHKQIAKMDISGTF